MRGNENDDYDGVNFKPENTSESKKEKEDWKRRKGEKKR